jgi:hypothetical protein
MQPPAIFTAIEFIPHMDDDDLSMVTEPLLFRDDVLMGNDEFYLPHTGKHKKSIPFGLVILGSLTGFLIQMISLGAYAFMLAKYSEVGEEGVTENESGWFVYGVLSILTQIDLILYVTIWAAFTCTMTRNGMEYIRLQYRMPVKQRSIFVVGVYFLVGIVLGAFVAWTMIDMYLGFPIPFIPIIVTVLVDLLLCYLMVLCYDLGGTKGASVEDDEDDKDDDTTSHC